MQRNRMTWMAAALGAVAFTSLAGCGKGNTQDTGTGQASIMVHQQALANVAKVTVNVSSPTTGDNITVPLVGNSETPATQYSAIVSDLKIACDYVVTATATDSSNTVIYLGSTTAQCISKNQIANITIDMEDQTTKQTVTDEAPFIDSLSQTASCVSVNDTVVVKASMHDIDVGDTAGMTWSWSIGGACGVIVAGSQIDTAGNETTHATSQITFKAAANTPAGSPCQVNLTVNDGQLHSTLVTTAVVAITIGDSCAYGTAKITAIPDSCPAISGVHTSMSPLVNGQTATLSVSASDPDVGNILGYNWVSSCVTAGMGHFVSANSDGSATGNPVQFVYTNSGNSVDCTFNVTVDDGKWTSGNLAGQTMCSVIGHLSVPGTSSGYVAGQACKFTYDYQTTDTVVDADQVNLEVVAPCSNPTWSAGTAIAQADLISPFTSGVTFTAPAGASNNVTIVTVSCGSGETACSHDFSLVGKQAVCNTQPDGYDCTSTAQLTNKCITHATCNGATKQCVAQTSYTCPASTDPCNDLACDPTTGNTCKNVPAHDGATCDNHKVCDGTADKCGGGTCSGTGTGVVCQAGNACTTYACSETSSPAGQCVATYASSTTSCDDTLSCTTTDHCDGAGTCGGTAVKCAAGYVCTEPNGPSCVPFICDRPALDKDVVPYFYGLGATSDGSAWGAGTFYGSYDFGTGTTLTALSADAFLVKYDSAGTAVQQWNFGDTPNNHDQTAAGMAVSKSGNVIVIGSFSAEIDFTSAGSNSGTAGVDYLSSTSVVNYYAVIDGASTGTDPTPMLAHMAALGTGGSLLAAGSNLTQDAFAICGKASVGVAAFGADASKKGILSATGTAGGGMDIVVAKIDGDAASATKGQVKWGKQFGGTGDQICTSVTVDYNGDVIITGTNAGTLVLGGTTLTAPTGSSVLFVAKLNGTTGAPISAVQFGAAGSVVPKVAVDRSNNIAIAGGMKNVGTDITFATSPSVIKATYAGSYDLFAVKLDTNLTPKCAFSDGDANYDQIINSVDFDSAVNIVMAGGFIGTLPGLSLTNTSITAQDIVELTLDANCAVGCVKQYGSAAGNQQGNLVSVANASTVPAALQNSVWLAGSYSDTITWDTTPASTLNSGGTGITHNFIARQK